MDENNLLLSQTPYLQGNWHQSWIRVCVYFSLLYGILSIFVGAYYSTLSIRFCKHGFLWQRITVVDNNSNSHQSSCWIRFIDGYSVAWIRQERWGHISDEVNFSIFKDVNRYSITMNFPYRSPIALIEIKQYSSMLAQSLEKEELFTLPSTETELCMGELIRYFLMREEHNNYVPFDIDKSFTINTREISYPYMGRSFRQFARDLVLGLVLLVCGIIITVSAAWAISRTHRYKYCLATAQSLIGGAVLIMCISECVSRSWDAVLGPINLGICFLFGFIPLIISISYILFLKFPKDNSNSANCLNCKYSLMGNCSGICPECGTEFDPELLKKLQIEEPSHGQTNQAN